MRTCQRFQDLNPWHIQCSKKKLPMPQDNLVPAGVSPDPRSLKIVAKSIFKELRANGYSARQVISLATELISLVTTDLAHEHEAHEQERELARGTGSHPRVTNVR